MARATNDAVIERIEIVDQPEDDSAGFTFKPWLFAPILVAVVGTVAFFLIRRFVVSK